VAAGRASSLLSSGTGIGVFPASEGGKAPTLTDLVAQAQTAGEPRLEGIFCPQQRCSSGHIHDHSTAVLILTCALPGSDWAARVSAYEQIRDLLRSGGANAPTTGSMDVLQLVMMAVEHAGTNSANAVHMCKIQARRSS